MNEQIPGRRTPISTDPIGVDPIGNDPLDLSDAPPKQGPGPHGGHHRLLCGTDVAELKDGRSRQAWSKKVVVAPRVALMEHAAGTEAPCRALENVFGYCFGISRASTRSMC
ncbi:MAG: hypothetical protein K0S78_4158 [Thermomicrobiales bacterium]|nr:hypothetical protein [Thermomicrobiales bacterium]